MKEEKINAFIDELKNIDGLDDRAYLGIYYDHENAFIKANKGGVLKLISSLLKGIKDFDFHLSKKDHFSIIKLEKEDWYDKDGIIIDFIEPTNKSKTEIYNSENTQPFKTSFKQKVIESSFFLILFFLLLSLVVGVFNVSKFIINLFL